MNGHDLGGASRDVIGEATNQLGLVSWRGGVASISSKGRHEGCSEQAAEQKLM